MISKLPIIGSPFGAGSILRGLASSASPHATRKFSKGLMETLQAKQVFLVNSGAAAFFVILETLKASSTKRQVVLPAYTAGNLVTCIQKAGLVPVLCDISLTDFNSGREQLLSAVSPDTLAVVLVHMFGIGIHDIRQIKERLPPEVTLIEDCAQAMGSQIDHRPVGNFSEISFFSFNRGKNFPLYEGGCIATNRQAYAEDIDEKHRYLIKKCGMRQRIVTAAKICAFSFATNPFVYGAGYPLIARYKDTAPAKDISLSFITPLQAGLGIGLLKRFTRLCLKRYENGMFLISALQKNDGLMLPQIHPQSRPVFNRLPLVCKDLAKKAEIEKRLWEAGIESSSLYQKPLHHIFNLGYRREDFPHARYFAEHLITLPVHPQVKQQDLLRMAHIFSCAEKR